jgi:hypothetical protein
MGANVKLTGLLRTPFQSDENVTQFLLLATALRRRACLTVAAFFNQKSTL